MAKLPDSTAFLSLAELGRLLRSRRATSEQLTEFYLDRLHRYGPRLNAVVTITGDLALEQARRADKELAAGHDRGPLHGIPCGVKDLLDTAGIRTTWGAPPFAQRVPKDDATVVLRLRNAGAPLVGKLAMIELAGAGDYRSAAAALTGPARNPWDPRRWTGGSSSGPGAAVAAGLVGFAIGSETWGSIVNPSTYCGIAGVRPTYGRVSRAGAMTLSWTMDKIGVMARHVADLAPGLAAIAGPDARDASALPGRFHPAPLPKRLDGFRLGYFSITHLDDDNPAKQPYLRALDVFRSLGATLVETGLPDLPYDEAAGLIIDAEGSSAFEPMLRQPAELQQLPDEGQIVGIYAGAQLKAVDYLRALRVRRACQEAMLPYLDGFDAIVAIAETDIAPLADVDFETQEKQAEAARKSKYGAKPERKPQTNQELSGAGNLLGLPAVAVSMGFSAKERMPVGLEIMSSPLHEARLMQIAHAYQMATPWHRQHPDLSRI